MEVYASFIVNTCPRSHAPMKKVPMCKDPSVSSLFTLRLDLLNICQGVHELF